MAVMKTFCGCCSTRSGALTILAFNLLVYAGGILMSALRLGNPDTTWAKEVDVPKECITNSTSEFKDSWWCTGLSDFGTVERDAAIGKLVMNSLLLLASLLAIYGVTSDKSLPMLPSLVGEFLLLLICYFGAGAVLVVLTIYAPGGIDITTSLAIGFLVLIVLVFLTYLWLCLVSHYQSLKDVEKMQRDKDQVEVMQYPYGGEMDVESKGGYMDDMDLPTERTNVTPPPEYTPPEDPPLIEDINLDDPLE